MFAKDFFKDRLILFLGFTLGGLALLNILLIALNIDSEQVKIVFRHWLIEGHSQFYNAEPSYLYSFLGFTGLVLLATLLISYRVYDTHKPAAYCTLFLGQIVLVANFLISEALIRVTP